MRKVILGALFIGVAVIIYLASAGVEKTIENGGEPTIIEAPMDAPIEGPMEEPVMEPMVEEVIAPVVMEFVPLAYDGNDRKFAKMYKGKKVKIPASLGKLYGAKKGVRIGKDVYFKGKHALYVFHEGKLTIIKSLKG